MPQQPHLRRGKLRDGSTTGRGTEQTDDDTDNTETEGSAHRPSDTGRPVASKSIPADDHNEPAHGQDGAKQYLLHVRICTPGGGV